jgi:hypothetical protein
MNHPKILLIGDPRLEAFSPSQVAGSAGQNVVGWREWAGLPVLNIARLMAKVDTGARTSALHANFIDQFERNGQPWVRFDVAGEAEGMPWHEVEVLDQRLIRSSNGETEMRNVIRTELYLAGRTWPIELTLTNRERMELPMLIGREALAGRVLVDAEKSWLSGRLIVRPPRSRPADAPHRSSRVGRPR